MLRNISRPRRVAITGFGCVTPIGIGKGAYWDSLASGRSGIKRITSFDPTGFQVTIAGEVADFDPESQIEHKDVRNVPRVVTLALGAAREAAKDAGIETSDLAVEERRRAGVIIGTGGGGFAFTEKQFGFWYSGNEKKGSIYTIPASTHGGLSSEISMIFGFHGASHVISTGCTSSTDAIFYAAEHIALGREDLMITGGVDSPIAPGILRGFEVMTLLTREWNDEPSRASRPFSKDRSGIVIAEGAWMFILEPLDKAKERGAQIYAEIAGYGTTCDAFHRVRLEENGVEPARAMQMAISDAGLTAADVDYVNLHGTATQLNDRIETRAVKLALGDDAYRVPMSATKSQVGHPQGAAGSAGVGAALFALNKGIIAPTINLETSDDACDLDYVPNHARQAQVNTALCNCIGFGSKNSALVLRAASAC